MGFIRSDRMKYKKRPVRGDHKITSPVKTKKIEETASLEQIESLYNDDVRLSLLEKTENNLSSLEDLIKNNLSDFSVLISPNHTQLVKAVSVLKGEPSLLLDFETIDKSLNLSMGGFIHSNGMDPVAAALGLHGETDGVPNAPVPTAFMDCKSMENLENVPSPEDENYKVQPIDDMSLEMKETNAFDLLSKLWRIFKYYPGLSIVSILENLKIKPIVKPIQKAIDWVNCQMVYPAMSILTGEARTCKDDMGKTPIPSPYKETFIEAEDTVGRGMDCLEAAAQVISYCDLKFRDNKDIRALFSSKEERALHEASKFGMLTSGIKNKAHFQNRINNLFEKTKQNPLYKKRYYDHKDTFSPNRQYQMVPLEQFENTTENAE